MSIKHFFIILFKNQSNSNDVHDILKQQYSGFKCVVHSITFYFVLFKSYVKIMYRGPRYIKGIYANWAEKSYEDISNRL